MSRNGSGGPGRAPTSAWRELIPAHDTDADGGDASAGDPAGEKLGHSPFWVIAANNVVYMAAPLSLPATMARCGWFFGTLILVYSILCTYHSGLLIGDIILERPHLDSYPKILGEALVTLFDDFLRLPLDRALLRRVGSEMAIVLQFMAYFFDTMAQVLFCAEYFDELTPEPDDGSKSLTQKQWLLVTGLLAIPLMQAPNFSESRVAVVAAAVCLFLNVATFLAEVLIYRPWNCVPGPEYQTPDAGSVMIGFTAFAYAFGGHGMYPEEMREMQDRTQWPRVIRWTYVLCVGMYVLCAYLGYYAYGSAARANLNLNFPLDGINTFSIIVQLVVTYYCIYVTSLVMLLHVEEHAFGIDPRTNCGESSFATTLVRFVFRTAFLGLQVLLCWFLIDIPGDVLLTVQSLSGAIGMTALTYILPFVVHWILQPHRVRSWGMRAWYVINIVLGVQIMIGGTVSGITELVDGLFPDPNGPQCTEFEQAPRSPCDPCYRGGLPEQFYDLAMEFRNGTCGCLLDAE